MKGINLDIVLFVMNTILFALLLFLIEKKFFVKVNEQLKSQIHRLTASTHRSSSNSAPPNDNDLDDDVDSERQRVLNTQAYSQKNDDLLTVTNLQKDFGKFKAVQGLSFGVHYGECFGFLGINGAGKTTSFK